MRDLGLLDRPFAGATASAPGFRGQVPAPAAGDQAKVLQGDGTWVTPASAGSSVYWAKISNGTDVSVTTTATATLNRMHVVTGTSADYTITISGLSPAAGDVLGFRVSDFSAASKVYKLDAGGTVKLAGRTRYLSLVHTNVILIQWDGTDWQPLVLELDSPWIADSNNNVITGSTTNPTIGTTSIDKMLWRRQGASIKLISTLRQTGAGTAGSGDYRWTIPMGAVVDTTALQTATVGTFGSGSVLGAAGYRTNGTTGLSVAYACLATSTSIGINSVFYINTSANGDKVASSADTPLSTAVQRFFFSAEAPIVDW
ncbi:MAG: hypothetical protein RL030_2758 [Pseudomonadota bacterium]|jgi:hypothetical protein